MFLINSGSVIVLSSLICRHGVTGLEDGRLVVIHAIVLRYLSCCGQASKFRVIFSVALVAGITEVRISVGHLLPELIACTLRSAGHDVLKQLDVATSAIRPIDGHGHAAELFTRFSGVQ